MKNKLRILGSLVILAVFVILNWATSQDVQHIELNAEASIFQDSLIVFNNLDEIAVTNATLTIIAIESSNFEFYSINDYNLSGMSSDTLEMTDFLNSNNIAYPDSIPPVTFDLSFLENGTENSITFSTDL